MKRATLDNALKSISSKRKTYNIHYWVAHLTPVEILALYESGSAPVAHPHSFDYIRVKAMVRAGLCSPIWFFWPRGKDDLA